MIPPNHSHRSAYKICINVTIPHKNTPLGIWGMLIDVIDLVNAFASGFISGIVLLFFLGNMK